MTATDRVQPRSPQCFQKALTWCSCLLAIAVISAAAWSSYAVLVEAWWLDKLESDESSERQLAARRLGELESLKAVPELLRNLDRAYERDFSDSDRPYEYNFLSEFGFYPWKGSEAHDVLTALRKIGKSHGIESVARHLTSPAQSESWRFAVGSDER